MAGVGGMEQGQRRCRGSEAQEGCPRAEGPGGTGSERCGTRGDGEDKGHRGEKRPDGGEEVRGESAHSSGKVGRTRGKGGGGENCGAQYTGTEKERLGRERDRPVLGKYRGKEDDWNVAKGLLSA